MWEKFWKEGKWPSVEAEVGIDPGSLAGAAAAVFIAGLLIILAYFTVKKLAQ